MIASFLQVKHIRLSSSPLSLSLSLSFFLLSLSLSLSSLSLSPTLLFAPTSLLTKRRKWNFLLSSFFSEPFLTIISFSFSFHLLLLFFISIFFFRKKEKRKKEEKMKLWSGKERTKRMTLD